MQKIIYLTFYFEPDLCAGSFRNSSLAKQLAEQALSKNVEIELYTTFPNRYDSFKSEAKAYEKIDNIEINRIKIPSHKSGIFDQILAFIWFYFKVYSKTRRKEINLVFASSSRLFTAFLGYKIAKRNKAFLYLDIRDIFVDTISDLYKNSMLKTPLIILLKRIENKVFNYAKHINLISPGFKKYFEKFQSCHFTFFTNGIDEEFLNTNLDSLCNKKSGPIKNIVYAGNIGEGQGLHKIIPKAAKLLGRRYKFHIYGDGGAKSKLVESINSFNCKNNVTIYNPVDRQSLRSIYEKADYLFIHLNNHEAFKKVLPSKIFELATYSKTIIAGVEGYAREFIENEIIHSIVFRPCNVEELINKMGLIEETVIIDRLKFKEKFRRNNINKKLSKSILEYL